jgi:hypothetical protein
LNVPTILAMAQELRNKNTNIVDWGSVTPTFWFGLPPC